MKCFKKCVSTSETTTATGGKCFFNLNNISLRRYWHWKFSQHLCRSTSERYQIVIAMVKKKTSVFMSSVTHFGSYGIKKLHSFYCFVLPHWTFSMRAHSNLALRDLNVQSSVSNGKERMGCYQWLYGQCAVALQTSRSAQKCVGTLEICQITSDGRNVYLEALNWSMVAVSLLHSLWVYLVLNYYIKAHWHGGTQLVALVRN